MATMRELLRRATYLTQLAGDYVLHVNQLQSSLASLIGDEHWRREVIEQLLVNASQVLDRLKQEYNLVVHLIDIETTIEESERESEAGLNRPTAVADAMAAVRNMKRIVVESEDSSLACVICQDELGVGEEATVMACSHKYHQACLFQWLQQRNTCPICRSEVQTV